MAIERWLLVLRQRVRSLVAGRRLDRELDEELAAHVEQQIAANVAAGMPPADARTAALRAMGGLQQQKEKARDARGWTIATDLVRDARYAARSLNGRARC